MTTLATSSSFVAVTPVRRLIEVSNRDVDYAGGKGANLGELTRAGFPVPPGFVVGAPAYAAFRRESGLSERLDALLAGLDVEDTNSLADAADAARDAVLISDMPAWLRDAIANAYDELAGYDDMPVAVRSSATAEGTSSASFASLNETFLNVAGRDAVIDAVKRRWASLFGARTIHYRAKRGFGHSDMDIAVVVQCQIHSTRAGVMFTINPATGDADELVIEGSFGLGEAVVSGQVSPDRYVVSKSRESVSVRSVRPKELVIESAPEGGTLTRRLDADESHEPALSDEEVLRLAELGEAIEREYGSAQDIEWAFDPEGKVWMLATETASLVLRSDTP